MQLWGSWTFFGIAFLWDWNENWPFQSCGYCWVFQIFWHTECSTFIASSFRIWNSSTGILSPPLALFIVMLPKAHSTSYSRVSGSMWGITPSWLFRSLRPFLYCSSVYCCYLLISSASVRSIWFLSFIVPIFAWNVPLVSLIFLNRSHSIVFVYFFALITEEGFLIYPCYSLELCIHMGVSFLFSFAFHVSSKLFLRPSQTTILHLFFLGMVWIPASCTMSRTSVRSSSGTLSIRSNPLNLFLTFTV